MIVYGNQHHEVMKAALAGQLRSRVKAYLHSPAVADSSVEHLRTLLIASGELEQAAHDALSELLPPEDAQEQIRPLPAITACAADAFYSAYALKNPGAHASRVDVRDALAEMADALDEICLASDERVAVKTPEGFAFYALYPEQYVESALRWSLDHASVPRRRAIAIGIRTIGTTLAAAVTAALSAAGWDVRSLTVRPSRHPFARQVELIGSQIRDAEWGLVVDEGPGLSGSSMASAGEALARAGMPRSRISFFPGHGGEPGSAASETVRSWWATTPRYVTAAEDAHFDGRSLVEALAVVVSGHCAGDDPVVKIEDFGGGLWRDAVYPDSSMWPPICARFEQPKYRFTTCGGKRFLLKFAGLNSAPGSNVTMAALAATRMAERAEAASGAEPLCVTNGFIASEWVKGMPLTQADGDLCMLARIGRYVAEVAGQPLSAAEQQRGAARLTEMLYWNSREAINEAAAEQVLNLRGDLMRAAVAATPRAYGDGRLSPHEWLRTPSGKLIKVDNTGHDLDHTIVGSQSVAWDLAGAIVEWALDASATAYLLKAFQSAGGGLIPDDAMAFHCLAYAAFRAGQFKLCAEGIAENSSERTRMWQAYDSYRDEMARRLNSIEQVLTEGGSDERARCEAIHF